MNDIVCTKCAQQKPRKDFQKDSKEYKSCNQCRSRSEKVIYDGFKKCVELFDGMIEK